MKVTKFDVVGAILTMLFFVFWLAVSSARANDILYPEFVGQTQSNLVERAETHIGEPGSEASTWELLFPKTTAAIGGVLGAVVIWWAKNYIDVGDSNGGPDSGAAEKLQEEKERQAQQEPIGPSAPVGEISLLVNGTFTGSPELLQNGTLFTPSLTFSSVTQGQGQVTSGNSSLGGQSVTGTWTGGYGTEMVIKVPDPEYAGVATVTATSIVINGRRLFAVAGATILITRNVTE